MTQTEVNILNQRLKNWSLGNIVALVMCTASSVGTVLGVYYGFRNEQQLMKLELKVLEQRVEKLEASNDWHRSEPQQQIAGI